MNKMLQTTRKRIVFISLFTFHFSLLTHLSAQTIPNGGFEDWWVYPNTIYETPKNWTDNDLLYQHFDPGYKGITVLKTTRSHSGKYALQMGVAFDHDDTVNGGIYSTGTTDSLLQVIYHTSAAGFKCSQKYATFTGFYIFNCLTGDTAVFGAILTKWNWVTRKRDTVVNSILRIGDLHTDYVPFVVPLKYRIKNEVPDTAFVSVGIQSQSVKGAKIGTQLIIDDLSFSGRIGENEEKNQNK
jgi:hypothetical protein